MLEVVHDLDALVADVAVSLEAIELGHALEVTERSGDDLRTDPRTDVRTRVEGVLAHPLH
jgi:hypothetical protein